MRVLAQLPEDIRLVSWDVDGTLYSLRRLKLRCLLALCQRTARNGVHVNVELLRRLRALHRWMDTQRVRARGEVDEAAWAGWERVRVWEEALFTDVLTAFPMRRGARGLLEHFARCGVPQVTLSDLPSEYKLRALGVRPYFDATFDASTMGHWKPSPLPFHAIERTYGVRPRQHLHIGDRRDTDGAGAVAAGCHYLDMGAVSCASARATQPV